MSLVCRFVMMLIIMVISASVVASEATRPYLFVLGVGQDAGYPQAGCYQPHCLPGWRDARLRRGAVSLGLIDPLLKHKYMFEATPNFPEQFYHLEEEATSDEFTFAGIFLTHAHIGHYAGLMYLGQESMGASGIPVFAMPKMTEFLKSNGPWGQLIEYNNITMVPLRHEVASELGNVTITPFLVPHRDEYSETVGFRIKGPDKTAVFIPDINKWDEWQTDLAELVASVDYALLDAAFFADGELPGRDMSVIPHPFVSETMAILRNLSAEDRAKVWFIHMNHTNPLLNPDSQESQLVREKGFNIANEGDRLPL